MIVSTMYKCVLITGAWSFFLPPAQQQRVLSTHFPWFFPASEHKQSIRGLPRDQVVWGLTDWAAVDLIFSLACERAFRSCRGQTPRAR